MGDYLVEWRGLALRCCVGALLLALATVGSSGSVRLKLIAPADVYLRTNFDPGDAGFVAAGNAVVSLAGPDSSLAGQSLQIGRRQPGGYFGAILSGLSIAESKGLRIAFTARTLGLRAVTVNLFDDARQDNTTPASPARTIDDEWRTVVFHAEDFHYNSAPPDRKIGGNERFSSLMFHGVQVSDDPHIWIDRLVVYRGPDSTPPSPPADVVVAAGEGGGVDVRWRDATDDTTVAVYGVHRQAGEEAWVKVGESLRTSYHDVVPEAGAYRYRVTAADYEHNVSDPSEAATVSVSAGQPPAALDAVVEDRLAYADHLRAVHDRGRGIVRPGVFLFAGDSITGAAVYTHVLGSWLGRGQTIRQGVASVTAAFGAANIGEYLRNGRPEFAIIMYGTNDGKGGRDVRNAVGHLATVIDACLEAGTIPIVATIPPRGYSRRQGDQERFNEAVVALARDKRVPISYVFEDMMQQDLNDMLSDGTHLTSVLGNDAAGRALRRTMDQVWFALR